MATVPPCLTFDFWSGFMILPTHIRMFRVNRALLHIKQEQRQKQKLYSSISLLRSILVIVEVRLARVPQVTLSHSTPLQIPCVLFGFREEEGVGRFVPAARKRGVCERHPALHMLSCPDLPRP